MSNDQVLFGDDPHDPTDPPVAPADGISDWQVEMLRRALDAVGVTDMIARRELIEQLARRPVESLRQLMPAEARDVLAQLQSRTASSSVGRLGSSWDARDEDTWIDRL